MAYRYGSADDKETDIEQLIGSNTKLEINEIEQRLEDALQNFIDLRNLPEPYYNWNSLTDKWAEYDRCYEVRAKNDRQDYEYAGNSNIMLPDYHSNIETLKTREMNALFSGADMFDALPVKYSTAEDAVIAKRLVKHGWALIDNFRAEHEKVIQDRLNYGTCFARVEYIEEEVKSKTMINDVLDNDGNPTEIDGVPQKVPEAYPAWRISEKKYTDFEHLDAKRVYLHTRIEKMKNQECVFIFQQKSYLELLKMESDGFIGEGMAEYIKDFKPENNDPALDEAADSRTVDDSILYNDEIKVYDLYLTYFYSGENDDRALYEGIYIKGDKLVGLREHSAENIGDIILKGVYIAIPGCAHGMGVGDEQYPSYISKNARFNQIFDLSSFEIKGGGFKDPQMLPGKTVAHLRPGVYTDVPGLGGMLREGAKPILSWGELSSKRPSESGFTAVEHLNEAMQRGTGATNLLAGMPTNTDIDKTVGGIEQTIDAGNERINSYLGRYENDILKRHAEITYKNYQDNLVPSEDLPAMFDEVDLYYMNENGEETEIAFPDYLMDIQFNFVAVKRIIDSEEKIGKTTRFLGLIANIVGQVSPVMPELATMIVEKLNWEFVITDIARSVGLTDLDRLFPKFNPIRELVSMKRELTEVSQQNDMLTQGIQMATDRFKEDNNHAALGVINELTEAMSGQGEPTGMGSPQ